MKATRWILVGVAAAALGAGVFLRPRSERHSSSVPDAVSFPGNGPGASPSVPGSSAEPPPVRSAPRLEAQLDDTRVILGAGDRSPRERLDACDRLPTYLPKGDVVALLAFMRGGCPPGMPDGKWHELWNNLSNRLRGQQNAPDGMTDLLLAVAKDSRRSSVQRDYAIQHARGWYADHAPDSKTETDPAKRRELLDMLWTAAITYQEPWSGTALFSLQYIEQESAFLPEGAWTPTERNRFSGAVLGALSTGSHPGAVQAALQVCERRLMLDGLPGARRWFHDESQSYPLRMSALRVITALAPREEVDALLASPSASDDRFAAAGRSALALRESREASSSNR